MIETSIENVLTLIARPDGLDDAIVAAAVRALKGLGLEPAPPDWLAPGEAVDIPFNGTAPKTAERAAKGVVRDALGDAPVDLCCGPVPGRRWPGSTRSPPTVSISGTGG